MGIAVRASGTGSYNLVGSSQSVSAPTGAVAGDLMVAAVAFSISGTSFNVPSGWTSVGNTNVASHPVIESYAIYRIFQAGDTSWTFGFTATTTAGIQLQTFSGVNQATPIDSTATPTANAAQSTLATTADTIVTANSWLIIGCGSVNATSPEFSATGFTEVDCNTTTTCAGLLYNGPLSSGSTGAITVTAGGLASGQNINLIPFAIAPAAPVIVATAWRNPMKPVSFQEPPGIVMRRRG